VLAEGWWAPYTRDRPHLLYSLSKSFTSTALGFAVAEGLVGLDDLVVDHFPQLSDEVTDPGSRAIRVRHVAAMASGHQDDTWDRAVAGDLREPVRGFLLLPPEHEPGTMFAYNQSATYSLAAILQSVTGQSLTDYLRPRLFEPLGISGVGWQQHPRGRDLGFSGLHATTDALARLGQLYLQRGRWGDQQLLSEEWVAEATRAQVANPQEPNPDWRQGYGFQFWMSRHGYRGDGAYGQFCLVLPEHDLVVASTAGTDDMQGVLDGVWEHLLPAVDRASTPEADAALRARLGAVTLPPYVGADRAADADGAGVFRPAGGGCAEQPSLTSVEVAPACDGWEVTLVEARKDSRTRAHVEPGRWTTVEADVPTAATGGWTDEGLLRVEVVFLETPHRLEVTCSPTDRTFEVHWVTAPLGQPPLRQLRSPGAA
jgi:CubicO group peptidase (beta-lactamase class C family)